jgi:hypothetical protein
MRPISAPTPTTIIGGRYTKRRGRPATTRTISARWPCRGRVPRRTWVVAQQLAAGASRRGCRGCLPRAGGVRGAGAAGQDRGDLGLAGRGACPRAPNGNLSRPQCVRWVAPEPCREGAMTRSHVRALSGRAGALLGAIAVLVTGCAAAGGGSGPQAGQSGAAQAAARSSGHIAAHRAAGTTRPGGSESRIARDRQLPRCVFYAGRPVAVSGSPVAVPRCQCCRWCACAWSCCGCGPGRWPARPYPAWQFCSCWRWPPSWGGAPISPACGLGCRALGCRALGCRARVCPAWRQRLGPGPARGAAVPQDRFLGGMTAGAR